MALKDILEKLAQKTMEDLITQGQQTPENDNEGAKVAVLTLSGAIMGGSGRGGFGANQPLNIDSIKPKLAAISKMKDVKAIALDINSPGGSPYHSRAIADAIGVTAHELGVPVHAFVGEVAASGGYWLACAADDIYVAPESIVGSIGVVSAGFGFDKAIEKLGVERRVYTAGKSKVTNDPFQPENPEGLKKANELREKIHGNFIDWVESRRPSLDKTEELFDGSIFLGEDAVRVGLADDLGSLDQTLKAKYGSGIKLVKPRVAPKGLQDLFQMAGNTAENAVSTLGHSIGAGVVDRTATRAENEVTERRFRFRT